MTKKALYIFIAILTVLLIALNVFVTYRVIYILRSGFDLPYSSFWFVVWLPFSVLSLIFQILIFPKRTKAHTEEHSLEDGIFDVIEKNEKRIPMIFAISHLLNAVGLSFLIYFAIIDGPVFQDFWPPNNNEDTLALVIIFTIVLSHLVLYWQLIEYWMKRQVERVEKRL